MLLENKRFKQLRFAPLATTVYLSHLLNRTHSQHLFSIRLPNSIRNEGCFIVLKGDWEKNNKKHFQSVEITNDIIIYIIQNECSRWKLITHTASETLKCLNTT